MKNQLKQCISGVILLLFVVCGGFTAEAAPSIYSKTGIIIDASTGKVLYEKYPDQYMAPASMTKLMTAYITFEEVQAGRITLEDEILVTAEHAKLAVNTNFQSTCPTLVAGNYETVDTLLHLIFQKSASVPCVMLAEHISGTEAAFVERMNETAARFSMDAKYENSHGAYLHYMTARAQARLVQMLIEQFPLVYEYAMLPSFTHRGMTYSTVTQLVKPTSQYYHPDVTGLKIAGNSVTGTCLSTTVERDGEVLIIVTFFANNTSYCYPDHLALIDYGFQVLASQSSPYHDVTEEAMDMYEGLRQSRVNLQGENGWMRPNDYITLGEFSVSFITALEQLNLIEREEYPYELEIWDIAQYPNKDVLLRGVAYGILPVTESFSFSPTVTMPQVDISTIFNNAKAVLGSDAREYYYEGWDISPDEPITREDALYLILGFLQQHGALQEVGNYTQAVSSWAEHFVTEAEVQGLIPNGFTQSFTQSITRTEIAQLLVSVVETRLNTTIAVSNTTPFGDTSDLAVAKAYELGLASGKTEGMFYPDSNATRQELAVMFQNTLDYLEENTGNTMTGQGLSLSSLQDVGDVAQWAVPAVERLLQLELMTGTDNQEFLPEYPASVEQCVAVCLQMYQKS